MAWTTPKTWVNQDPLNESNFNTYIRDNQVALRADTEDLKTKVGKTFPAFQSPRLIGEAIIGINASVSITATSLAIWHSKIKLTFTPKTDRVLLGVQLTAVGQDSGIPLLRFGLRKGSQNVTLIQTDIIDGDVGTPSDLVAYRGRDEVVLNYSVPVGVSRDTEVTISPTVRVHSGSVSLRNPSNVILTALEVGAYE